MSRLDPISIHTGAQTAEKRKFPAAVAMATCSAARQNGGQERGQGFFPMSVMAEPL
ncbi:MAG: hypothetical protein AB1696_07265 [Planctomycetota bacterium]